MEKRVEKRSCKTTDAAGTRVLHPQPITEEQYMSGYPGFQQAQQYPQQFPQHPQQMMTPWMQPSPVPAQSPVLPPSLEGTAFSGILGAGAAALATEGVMFLMNVRPQTLVANAALTGGVALLGGGAAAMGYRMAGNRAYAAAQEAAGMASVNPRQAASALRLGGKFGRLGNFEVVLPTQTIVEAADAWNKVVQGTVEEKSHTPEVVNEYFKMLAEQANQMAAQSFVAHMPPPTFVTQPPPQPQPQWAWQPPAPPSNGQ